MERIELAIGGMHCASCVARIERAVKAVPGVVEANVSLASEQAAVAFDPARASQAEDRVDVISSHGLEQLLRPCPHLLPDVFVRRRSRQDSGGVSWRGGDVS